MTAPAITRWVYDVDEGSRDMRNLLGGKGANVAEMTRILGADLVPAGFTVTTDACVRYLERGGSPPESASHGTPTGASCRCSATWSAVCPAAASRPRSRA